MPEVFFNGPEGRIEARYHQAEDTAAPVALVLHPHPLYGGTMNNKVVYNIFHSLVRKGFSVLRINFRGVGKSLGKYDNGVGELSDAASALDWLQVQNPDSKGCWIAGFSFGSWIAMQLMMRRPEIETFICSSPPTNLYDFGFLSPCPASGLITQGNIDSVVPENSVASLAEKLGKQKGIEVMYEVFDGADHYYRNKMEDLVATYEKYIDKRLQEIVYKKVIRPERRRRQTTPQ